MEEDKTTRRGTLNKTMTGEAKPDAVLDFWFSDDVASKWFMKDAGFDDAIRNILFPLYEAARRGELDHWTESPGGCGALSILLDQVPRNCFRDDPRAYATDAKARAIARQAIDRRFDLDLPAGQRLFLYLPFEHSETLSDQDLCVELIGKLDSTGDWLDYARRHREIIARFGRFSHRNDILGRPSTPEEIAFLTRPGSSF